MMFASDNTMKATPTPMLNACAELVSTPSSLRLADSIMFPTMYAITGTFTIHVMIRL